MVRTIPLASPKIFPEAYVVLMLPLLVVAHVPEAHTHNQSAGQGGLRQVLQGRPAVLAIGRRAHATGDAGRASNTGHGDSARVVKASGGGGTCDATTSMVAKCGLASGVCFVWQSPATEAPDVSSSRMRTRAPCSCKLSACFPGPCIPTTCGLVVGAVPQQS